MSLISVRWTLLIKLHLFLQPETKETVIHLIGSLLFGDKVFFQ